MSSSSDESEHAYPTNCKNVYQIPEKSKERYIATYDNFVSWQKEKNISSFSEDVLLAYFEEIAMKYKPSSLWAIYSMLKSSLKSKNGVNMESYLKLLTYLKKLSIGYVSKKSKALTSENVEKFIDEAPDEKYLATKVALILGVTGGLRSKELSSITTHNIENHGEVFLVKMPVTNQRHQGSFVIQGKYYNIVKKYQSLRTEKKGTSARFFQQYRNGKCSAQAIGKNKFGMMPREIAEFLNLPNAKDYTGHSFRKAAETPHLGANWKLKRVVPPMPNASQRPADDLINDSGSNSRTQNLQVPQPNKIQCRFCGQFTRDCMSVSNGMPYLAGNRTSLALNHLRVELDFSNDSLPKTVCKECNIKLNQICDFVQQVNTAQYSLLTVSEKVDIPIVKTELEDNEDCFTINDTDFVKKTNKRKIVDSERKSVQNKAKNKIETDVVHIKDEVIDVYIKGEPLEYNDTGTDLKPGDIELLESSLAYTMGNEASSVSQCHHVSQNIGEKSGID